MAIVAVRPVARLAGLPALVRLARLVLLPVLVGRGGDSSRDQGGDEECEELHVEYVVVKGGDVISLVCLFVWEE